MSSRPFFFPLTPHSRGLHAAASKQAQLRAGNARGQRSYQWQACASRQAELSTLSVLPV